MALTDQPYLPLYVDDWMNNNKLKLCSPAAHGLMISVMCIMHKEQEYGKILLKQMFKQSTKHLENFACQIARLCAFDVAEILLPLQQLLDCEILKIEGDSLICPRMVRDAEISQKRAKSGKSGGKTTQKNIKKQPEKEKNFASNFAKAKTQANAVNVIVNENVIENTNNKGVDFDFFWNDYDKKVGDKVKLRKKWEKLSHTDQEAIMEYIPKYKTAEPNKKFRKNPETFLNNKSWNDEIIENGKTTTRSTADQRAEDRRRASNLAREILLNQQR